MSQRITSSVTVQNLRQIYLTLEIHSLKLDPVASVITPYSQTRPAWAHGNAPCLLIPNLEAPCHHLRGQRKGLRRWVEAKLQWSPLMKKSNGAAAANSLQSCPTLCDPIDCSPPGSSIPGILQARIVELVAISFSKQWRGWLKIPLICLWSYYSKSPFDFTWRQLSEKGFPGGSPGKESACNARVPRDTGSVPGSGICPGGGHGNPLQYSCLENPTDEGAWRAVVHKVSTSQMCLKWLSTIIREFISK